MGKARQFHIAGLIAAAAISPAFAQDGGGTEARLSLAPGVFYDDDTSRARLGFGAGFETATRNQRLTLGFDGALDSGYDDIADSLRDPRLRLTYGMESRSVALVATLNYQRAQVDTLFLDDDPDSDLPDDFVVASTGQRTDLNAGTSLTFGRDAPFGGTFDLGYRQRSYQGTVDPSLLDEETRSAGLALRFDIDSRLTARVSGQVSETDVDDPGTDQRRVALNTGVDIAITPTLDASVTLGGTRITDTGPLDSETTEGFTSTISLIQDRPNGTLSGRLSSDVTTGGRQTTLQADRNLELSGGGTLGFGGGVGQFDNGDLQVLARLSWADETPVARYRVGLDRALAVNRDGDRAVNTQISASWQQDLDRISSIGAELALRNTERLGAGEPDTTQANMSLTYRRALTQDWGLLSRYTQRWTRETDADDTREQSVFLGLEREFVWRP